MYSYNAIVLRNKREPTNDTYNKMGKFQKYAETKNLTKEILLPGSIYWYMKFRTGRIIYNDGSLKRN